MNRIRKVDDVYQVLITPEIKIAPDNPLIVGNWEDENLRNYHILQFETLQDAQCEALEHPDIDWYRLVINHQHIHKRLEEQIGAVLAENKFNVEFKSKLMSPEDLKNIMFDRVMHGGERFNLRFSFNDIISFTIINPWNNNLHYISKTLETYKSHLVRDDLRIRYKKIIDGKIICLYGYTEFGTIYEIKLIPTLLHQWAEWYRKNGHRNQGAAEKLYAKTLKQQETLDSMPGFR